MGSICVSGMLGLVQACTSEKIVSVDVTAVTVTPRTADALEGEEIQLTATVLDENEDPLDGASVTWTSGDTSIVTVAPNGMARARSAGRTEVRAAFRDVWGSATVTVAPGPEIVVSRDSVAFFAGEGGVPPEPEVLQVTNGGGGTLGSLSFEIAYPSGEPDGWLEASLGGATAPTTLTLSSSDEDLPQGAFRATVALRSDGAKNDPMTIPVTLTVGGVDVRESGGSTAVSEAGSEDDFTVVLGARPTSDVVLTVTSEDTGEVRVGPDALRFTSENWDAPQTVTVEGVDDFLLDGDQVTDVTVAVNRTGSDPGFRAVPDQVVRVTTTDNDEPDIMIVESGGSTSVSESGSTDAFTVRLAALPLSSVILEVVSGDPGEATVAPTRLTFAPGDWSNPQTVTVTGVDDALIDGDQTTTVTVSVNAADSDDAFDGVTPHSVSVQTIDNDLADFTVTETGGGTTVSEAGGTDSFTVALDIQPASDVELSVTSGNEGEVVVEPGTLRFTSADWNQPKNVVVTAVDDAVDDGDQITTVTISVNEDASDDTFDGVDDRSVEVTTLDDDGAGISITETGGGTLVTEAGSTDQFTVALTSLVLLPVTLEIVSEDPGEATVSPATVTFGFTNWNQPRTITVTGVDDLITDGDQVSRVVVSVASGSDPSYESVSDRTVFVTTTDNDVAGFTVTESGGSTVVAESGGTDDLSVILDARPATNVVLTIRSADPGEATVSPTSATFTPTDWNVAQTVTVVGVDDDEIDGDQVTTITIAVDDALSDDAFDGLPDQSVSMTVMDDESFLRGSPAGSSEETGEAS